MANKITIENASLSVNFNGQAYEFAWLNSVTITDPRENTLSVSPQGKGDGVSFRTGMTTPVTSDFVVREVAYDLFQLLKTIFEDQSRADFLLYDQKNGDRYELNQSLIRNNPSNTSLAEGESTLDVPLNIGCAPHRFGHFPPEASTDEA